ncbi:centrosome-associated protein 350-like [Chiloscyllium plagiosum]|uniref:centrosome-associated protein 350-like n=1 Tax=Chiloscyllium plagiosum TaxID=36176 RepID=UPI001CB7ADD7|nr:centrosome-associated protein 350-like [Chiloscyllium plagiosum]
MWRLRKLQDLGHDPGDLQIPPDYLENNKWKDVESVSKRAYCEIFISNEVMKLFRFYKEQYQKTDWQKVKTFDRRKHERVDHILSYGEFVKKTEAELSKDFDVASSTSTKPPIKTLYSTATEQMTMKPLSQQK